MPMTQTCKSRRNWRKKALASLRWKKRLESYFNDQYYKNIESKIKQTYIQKKEEINLQESEAKNEANQKKTENEKFLQKKDKYFFWKKPIFNNKT